MRNEADPSNIILDELICEIPEKYIQWRLTVNIFRDIEYLHFRKYFMDMEGEFVPSKEGACVPVDVQRLANIMSALCKLLSDAEILETVLEHLDDEATERVLRKLKEKS